MGLKPGPKRIATSPGEPDQRQRDNKSMSGNTPSLEPSKSKKNSADHELSLRTRYSL